jgi:hypothetical protein
VFAFKQEPPEIELASFIRKLRTTPSSPLASMAGQRKRSGSAALDQVTPANPIRSALHRRQQSSSPLATVAGRGTNLAVIFVAALLSPATTASQEEQVNRRTPAKKETTTKLFIDGDAGEESTLQLLPPLELTAVDPPPEAPDLGQRSRSPTPKHQPKTKKPTSTPRIYSDASPSPSPPGLAGGEGSGSAQPAGETLRGGRRREGEGRREERYGSSSIHIINMDA